MKKPICFVLTPFGRKHDSAGAMLDFDAIYHEFIGPAVALASLQAVRGDEVLFGAASAVFQRLMTADYVVADLTLANPNVFYELGVRHALRPSGTVLIAANGTRTPFDISALPVMFYDVSSGRVTDAQRAQRELAGALRRAGEGNRVDSPVFLSMPTLATPSQAEAHDETEARARAFAALSERIETAAQRGADALREIEQEVRQYAEEDPSLLLRLFEKYLAAGAWSDVVRITDVMPPALQERVDVQQERALALNRVGSSEQAEAILTKLVAEHPERGETWALLGLVYKNRWRDAADDAGRDYLARPLLQKAIAAYLRAFEADPMDVYAGFNALWLIEMSTPDTPEDLAQMQRMLLPVVRYAAERRLSASLPRYFDYSTLLELAIIARDEAAAVGARDAALSASTQPWELAVTLASLRWLSQARRQRGETLPWADDIEASLLTMA